MTWLVTTGPDIIAAVLEKVLREAGCVDIDLDDPIPMENGELVFEVAGPDDLPKRIGKHPQVRHVDPSSEFALYR